MFLISPVWVFVCTTTCKYALLCLTWNRPCRHTCNRWWRPHTQPHADTYSPDSHCSPARSAAPRSLANTHTYNTHTQSTYCTSSGDRAPKRDPLNPDLFRNKDGALTCSPYWEAHTWSRAGRGQTQTGRGPPPLHTDLLMDIHTYTEI